VSKNVRLNISRGRVKNLMLKLIILTLPCVLVGMMTVLKGGPFAYGFARGVLMVMACLFFLSLLFVALKAARGAPLL